jgi:hypothetical protein
LYPKDYARINNRINDYIRELNDYKEDLDSFEKMAKLQNWNQQIEILLSEQKNIQELIEAAEYERAKTTCENPTLIYAFTIEKRKKLHDELSKIRDDVDKFV